MYSFDKLCSNLIPVGKYKVTVTDVNFRTKGSGETSRDIGVRYTIVDGPQAKRTLMDTIFEKSFNFRLRPFLIACGVDTTRDFATQEEMFEYALKKVKGKTLMVDVIVKSYNGKEYNNISDFHPLPGSTVKAEDVLKSFDTEPTVKGKTVEASKEETDISVEDDEPSLDVKDDDLPF